MHNPLVKYLYQYTNKGSIMNTEELLMKVKEAVAEPDSIIDVYDLSFVWVSQRLAASIGYTQAEITEKRTIDVYSTSPKEAQEIEREIILAKDGIIKDFPVKTKAGDAVTIRIRVHHLTFDDTPYMVGEFLEDLGTSKTD